MKLIGVSVLLASCVSAVPVANTINSMVADKALQFAEQMVAVKNSGGRNLQNEYELNIPEELQPCFEILFRDESDEYEPITEVVGELIECVRDAIVDIAEPCLGRFPGFWSPVKCTLFILLDPELILGATEGNNLTLIDENVFQPFEVTNQTVCEQTFGTAEEPKFPACLSLVETDDVTDFFEALEKNFGGLSGCSTLRDLFEGDGLAEAGGDIFGEYEYGLEADFEELFNDEVLAGLKENFQDCSEIDGGKLSDELGNRFQDFGAASSMHQVSLASFLAVVISSMFNTK